jgi:CheY-like chemotaxis protein
LPPAKNALVVDDNTLSGSMLAHLLMQRGYGVTEVSNATTALEHLKSTRFDVALLDIHMPKMSGNELCQIIRNELNLHALPVIAHTEDTNAKNINLMERAGFDHFMFKPIDGLSLDKILAKL